MSEPTVEAFSKDTFITALRNGSDAPPASEQQADPVKVEIDEPAAMMAVREKHAQLNQVVGSLSEKISAVLGRQEKDFLAAYRAHMYNVQKELHELREKMHRSEDVESKSEKIKKLEDERDWYRKEALRLDTFTASMTKDLQYMREKLESIEEDRNWLEKQLKACKKQNKLLRAELDVRVTPNGTQDVDSSLLPSFVSPQRAFAFPKKANKRQSSAPEDDDPNPVVMPDLAVPTLTEEREARFRKQIRTLKKELQQKTLEVTMLRRQCLGSDDNAGHSSLEALFLQCVESVREDVYRRKGERADRDERGAAPRAVTSDKTRHLKALAGTDYEDFTSSDRLRVIEKLLAHDEVLTLLYNQLFPGQPNATTGERPATTDGEHRESTPLSASASSQSLPDRDEMLKRRETSSNEGPAHLVKAAGSGAAAVTAARVRETGIPIDESTRDYLRSMRVQSNLSS